MKKFIITGMAVAMLAVPTAAVANPHAATPETPYMWNADALATEQGSTTGEWTSQITHNGWWVQAQKGEKGRSDVVQWVQSLDGQGRLAK